MGFFRGYDNQLSFHLERLLWFAWFLDLSAPAYPSDFRRLSHVRHTKTKDPYQLTELQSQYLSINSCMSLTF